VHLHETQAETLRTRPQLRLRGHQRKKCFGAESPHADGAHEEGCGERLGQAGEGNTKRRAAGPWAAERTCGMEQVQSSCPGRRLVQGLVPGGRRTRITYPQYLIKPGGMIGAGLETAARSGAEVRAFGLTSQRGLSRNSFLWPQTATGALGHG